MSKIRERSKPNAIGKVSSCQLGCQHEKKMLFQRITLSADTDAASRLELRGKEGGGSPSATEIASFLQFETSPCYEAEPAESQEGLK